MAIKIGELVAVLKIDSRGVSSSLGLTEGRLKQTGEAFARWGRRAALAFAAAEAAAVKFATDFEAEMIKIETLVGVNRDLVAQWADELKKLGPAVGVGPRQLSKALFVVTSAGIRTAEALEIVELAAKGTAVGMGDTATIARAVTAAMQAYKKAGLTAAQATDILTATVREGNLEAETLAGSYGRVLGIAAEVGVSFSDLSGFIATFTRVGVGAEAAVTSLRAIINTFLKPTQQAEEAMAEFDLSARELRKSIRERGLAVTLVELADVLSANEDALARVIPNVRALSGFLAVASAQSEEFLKVTDNIATAEGILDEAFQRTKDSAKQQFAVFKAGLEVVLIEAGDKMLPLLLELLPVLSQLSEGFVDLSRKAASFFTTVTDMLGITSSLRRSLKGNVDELKREGATIQEAGRLWLTLSTELQTAQRRLGEMQEKLDKMPANARRSVESGLFSPFQEARREVEAYEEALKRLQELLPELAETGRETAAALPPGVAGGGPTAVAPVKFSKTAGGVILSSTMSGAERNQLKKDQFDAFFADFADFAGQQAGLRSAVRDNIVEPVKSEITEGLNAAGKSAAQQLVNGFINGSLDMKDILKSFISQFVQNAILGPFFSKLQLFSPSRVMFDAGQNVVRGFMMGMVSMQDQLGSVSAQVSAVPLNVAGAGVPMTATAHTFNISGPQALTPREAALNSEWQDLIAETIRELETVGFRARIQRT